MFINIIDMSISDILVPNNLNLFAKSITADVHIAGLSPLQAVATDASSNLISFPYNISTNYSLTLMQRSNTGYAYSNGFIADLPLTALSVRMSPPFVSTLAFPGTTSSDITYNLPDPGTTACDVVVTKSNQTIDGDKTFTGITTLSNNLILPTTGGIASPLNFYEEYSFSTTFTVASGAVSLSLTVYLTRIGNICTILCPNIILVSGAIANNNIFSNTAFATQFRPLNEKIIGRIRVSDNGIVSDGLFAVQANGGIAIYRDIDLANYTTTAAVLTLDYFTGTWLYNL